MSCLRSSHYFVIFMNHHSMLVGTRQEDIVPMFQRAMLLAVVFVLSVSDSSNKMASFTASHSIHEK